MLLALTSTALKLLELLPHLSKRSLVETLIVVMSMGVGVLRLRLPCGLRGLLGCSISVPSVALVCEVSMGTICTEFLAEFTIISVHLCFTGAGCYYFCYDLC